VITVVQKKVSTPNLGSSLRGHNTGHGFFTKGFFAGQLLASWASGHSCFLIVMYDTMHERDRRYLQLAGLVL
jgi:hypothetical protein